MSLRNILSKHKASLNLVQSASGLWTTERVLDGIDPIRPRLAGARLAVRLSDAGEALRTLSALDGLAEAVVLIASSIPLEQIARMLELASVKAIVTDDVQEIQRLGFINAIRRIEDVGSQLEDVGPQAPRAVDETSWILATSGTSGDPKLVRHTLKTLTRTTKTDPVRGVGVRWGLLYEWARFAGLQTLLQSALPGSNLIAPPIHLPLDERIALFVELKCTHLSATPTMWRKIIMTPGSDRLSLRQISLGGEIADDRILNALSSIFPAARITHIYASTEAGVGFSVNDRRAGFPESYLTNPLGGCALRLVNGRLHVRNEGAIPAYIGTGRSVSDKDGWIDTGDNARIENGRVYFLGRESGVINVGGNKVHPEDVERVLLQYPGVVAARVYGKRSSITGALVVAEVVFEPEFEASKAMQTNLKQHAMAHLEAHKVPALISVVTNIECNETGKIVRSKQ